MKIPEASWLVFILLIAISIVISGCQSPPTVEDIEQAILKTSQKAWSHFPRGIEEIEVIKIGKKGKVVIGATYDHEAFPTVVGGHEETGWFVKVRLKGTYGLSHSDRIEAFFVFKRKGEWEAESWLLELFKE